jgi:tetratricopeptide (TPR) repeat protein
MIVKNESSIICRLLTSVVPHITSYCICDTGSTDNTIDTIKQFFKEHKNISGTLLEIPFVNFEINRTLALHACQFNHDVDYILLLDADMIFSCKTSLSDLLHEKKDIYSIVQGTDSFFYNNIRLLKTRQEKKCVYRGVTHEYIVHSSSNIGELQKKDVFIHDIGDGGCKETKTSRDIQLLQHSLDEDPTNDRTLFYLARTYYENKEYQKAITLFEKHYIHSTWIEEKWYNLYCCGKCYYELRQFDEAIRYWNDAYILYPDRLENIYHIMKYFREHAYYAIAYTYYEKCLVGFQHRSNNPNVVFLFMEQIIYDISIHYEFSIIGYYVNPKKYDVHGISMNLLSKSSPFFSSILSNYQFYTKSLDKECVFDEKYSNNYALLQPYLHVIIKNIQVL